MKNNIHYMEGRYAAERIAPNIERTTYGTLKQAYATKKELVKNFETQFGYSRDDENLDTNYAYNCGMMDMFAELIKK